MRTLAVDVGSKRIGIALSDAAGRLATPLDVIAAQPADVAISSIARLVERESVERIIVGLPLNMDDSAGPAADAAIDWARKLSRQCGIRAIFVDERLSSFAAEQQLSERRRAGENLTRGRKRQQLDALAAAGFLQEFLDGKLAPIELPAAKQHRK